MIAAGGWTRTKWTATEEASTMVSNMTTLPMWRSVAWLQRGLVIGVAVSTFAVAAGAVAAKLRMVPTPSLLLWSAVGLNTLLLFGGGGAALDTTRQWFRQPLLLAQRRRQRRAVRRRAVLLGLTIYLAHQTFVALLEPKRAFESFMGLGGLGVSVAPIPSRPELAWAFTLVAFGDVTLAWLLWRSAGLSGPVPSESPLLPGPLAIPPTEAVATLPRDPVTGRVVRQFDL